MSKLNLISRIKLAAKLTFNKIPDSDPVMQGIVAGLIPSTIGTYPARETLGLLETYNNSPWIRACASKVADAMSAVCWRLYVVRGGPEKKVMSRRSVAYIQRAQDPATRRRYLKEVPTGAEVEEVKDHIFLDMMNKANSEMTGGELRWLTSAWLDLVGDAFFVKERNNVGAPVALWPIPPNWVVETPAISRPTYRLAYARQELQVPASEILWMKYPNPVNPYGRGSGVTRALDDEISIDEFAAKHTVGFFRNNARPDLLVMPKEGAQLGVKERDRLEKWWTDKLQGFWRRYKPLFMTQPMDVQVIEQNFRNMQLTELRQSEADTIMQVWGTSPEIFGRLASSNKATVDKAIEIFARYVLLPILERQRAIYQERLIPEYDERLILGYDSPIPPDQEYALNVFKAQPAAFQLNEFRDLAGLTADDSLVDQYGAASAPGGFGQPPAEQGAPNQAASLDGLNDDELIHFHELLLKASMRQGTTNGGRR